MKFKAPLGILIAILLLENFTLRAQIPKWAVTHTHKDYPAGEFILGVGYGTGDNGEESAKRLAQSDIASQVRVKVQTEVRNVQQTYELNQNQETYADFKIRSTSVVDEQLTGAEIVATAVDPSTNTTYALAALNKEKFAGSIESELTRGWEQAAELRNSADEFLRHGKLNEAMQNLLQARTSVSDLLPKMALHDAIAGAPFHGELSLGPSTLTSFIRDVLSRVRIDKKGGDQQKGKVGEQFPEPFRVQLGIAQGETVVPVAGATISFLGSTGEALGEALTDAAGNASIAIRARGNVGSFIRARLSLQSLNREFSPNLNSSSKTFSCEVLNADVAFGLKINSMSPSITRALHEAVENAVTKIGYHVVDMSRFVLKVEFQSRPPSIIEGMGGNLFSVSSDISISLIDNGSAKTIGTVLTSSKSVAKSREAAIEKSAQGVAVDAEELATLLEKARN